MNKHKEYLYNSESYKKKPLSARGKTCSQKQTDKIKRVACFCNTKILCTCTLAAEPQVAKQ